MIKNLHFTRSLTRSLSIAALAIFMFLPGKGWGQVTIAIQDFETTPASPTWSYTTSGGTLDNTINRYNGVQSYRLGSSNTLTMNNLNISGYTSVVLSVAFASMGVDADEDLFMDISYDNGVTWTGTGSIKLVDGSANLNVSINATVTNRTVASNPWPTSISVAETQIRVRFRTTNITASEYYYIDDVKLTGTLAITPTKLAITSISPSQPTMGTGFNVTVQAQDGSNNPGNVASNTTFSLTTNGNAGLLSGTTTGQINTGSNSVTITGVTLATIGTGVTLTATRTAGDNLTEGTSNTFTVLEPATNLAFTGVPASGVINTSLSSFTVEARRPDNSVDNTYTGDVTLNKASGTGAISGTLIQPCIAGVATFTDIKFDAAETYTISAASGSLTGTSSGNIIISLTIPSPPTSLTFESVTYNSFTSSFTAQGTTPSGYLVLRRSVSAVTGTPAAGTEYTLGNTDIGGGINEVVYVGSSVWSSYAQSGLADNTAYHYAVYSYNGSGALTVYSATALIGNQTTSTIPAPTALDADPILSTGFTANWDAVPGASSYKIDIYTETAGANATDLFISEYIEGSSNNKYIELYNGTGSSIDLSNYSLRLFNNGTSTPSQDLPLSGTLANNSTIVYENASATVFAGSATISGACAFNGDDALGIYKPGTSSYVDIFGRIGNDPGSAWTSASNSTLDKTLVRKSTVVGGVTTNPSGTGSTAFTTLESEWTQSDIDVVSNLGSHTFSGGTIQTPVVTDQTVNGTSYVATGLDPNTEYKYRVRAVGVNSTSANSNPITTITLLSPVITVSDLELTGFTYEEGNGPSGEQSFTVSGENIIGNLTLTPPADYEISTASGVSFAATNPINLTPGSGIVGTTSIYVRLKAGLTAGDYNTENIVVASTDVASQNVICSGSVTIPVPAPSAFNVTGDGGKYCGTTGALVGLDGSESGVSYQLFIDGTTSVGSPIAGDGNPISFGSQLAGTYTVEGTNITGMTPMTGSATITITAAPTAYAGIDYAVFKDGTQELTTAMATNALSVLWEKTSGAGNGTLSSYTSVNPIFTATKDGPANFTFTATGYPGCGSESDVVTFIVVSTDPVEWLGANSNWNDPSNWAFGAVPVANNNVKIPNTAADIYPVIDALGSGVSCKNIEIEAGASLIDNGKLTLTSGGKITVHQPSVSNDRWHYISSPVSGAQSSMFTGDFLYNFNTSTNDYTPILSTTTSLDPMKGYALYVEAGSSYPYNGDLNKETSYGIPATTSGAWHLVGNPYPSAIDWDALAGWDKSGIDEAVYIYKGGSTWSNYVDGTDVNGGSNIIATTQGFFVRGNGGSFSMTHTVRTNDNSEPFYKNSAGVVPNLVRIEVSGNGYKDEAVVRFKTEATPDFDGNYDALKRYGDKPEAAQLYSLGNGTQLSINSLPETDMVPVGIKVGASGSYTITATEINDLNFVTLEDKETGDYTNLSAEPYTFESVTGDFADRFILHFSLLSVDETKKVSAIVYSFQQTVHINLKDLAKGDIYIYNIAGQLVATKLAAQGTNEIKLPKVGNYIVKVITKNNTVVRKVFIQ